MVLPRRDWVSAEILCWRAELRNTLNGIFSFVMKTWTLNFNFTILSPLTQRYRHNRHVRDKWFKQFFTPPDTICLQQQVKRLVLKLIDMSFTVPCDFHHFDVKSTKFAPTTF